MMRAHTRQLVEHALFTRIVIALIVLNAFLLGLETYASVMARVGDWLAFADRIILALFTIELALRMVAYGRAFWRDRWSLFDTFIVAISLMPAAGSFSVLRALRVLRVLRLISAFASLRNVVQGLFSAIPGIASIGAVLLILLYVFAVMATKLFSDTHPQWFGSLGVSLFSLFQIMTLEGWADMVRDIMEVEPLAWIFFVVYILTATFTVLNLFIAVIVEAMHKQAGDEQAERADIAQEISSESLAELRAIREELRSIKRRIGIEER